jgi:hypothetical protein
MASLVPSSSVQLPESEYAREPLGWGRFAARFDLIALALIVLVDAVVRVRAATSHTFWDAGDLLAPFSLFDGYLHGLAVDTSRQPWLLPWLMSVVSRTFVPDDLSSLLRFANGTTALISTATLLPTYAFARRFLDPRWALAAVLIVAVNAMFFVSSVYFNPTQAYGFFFTLTCAFMVHSDRDRRMLVGAALAALGGFAMRHEGALLLALTLGWILVEAWRGTVVCRFALGTCFAVGLASVAIFGVSIVQSKHPFAFLILSNAADLPSRPSFWPLLVSVLTWKLEKFNGLTVNLTIFAMMLLVPGWMVARRIARLADFPLIYLASYEAVFLVYSFAAGLMSEAHLTVLYQINADPTPRYYQILTPVLTVYVVVFLCKVVWSSVVARIVVSGTVLLLGFQQIATASYFYRTVFVATSENGTHRDLIALADEFRRIGARDANVVMIHPNGTNMDFDHEPPPFTMKLLFGVGSVNCVGRDLLNPNRTCDRILGRSYFDPARDPAAFVVVRGDAGGVGPLLYRNASFSLYGTIATP